MRGLVHTKVLSGPEGQRWQAGHVVGMALFVVLVAGGGIVAFPAGQAPRLGAAAAAIRPTTTTAAPARKTTTTTTAPASRLPPYVVSTSPVAGATSISPVSNITVHFSAPLVADTPDPSLSPAVPGTWTRTGPTTLTFRPREYFTPLSSLVLTVPFGSLRAEGRFGQWLESPYSATFTVAGVSELRLQQLLAELGYLPVWFSRSPKPAPTREAHQISPGTAMEASPTRPAIDYESGHARTVALSAQLGSFSWRYPHIPARLASLWQPGVDTAHTDGAVMAFQADHGLVDDGVPDVVFWSDLLEAVANRQVDTAPYDYLEVSTTLPETLSVWRDSKVIYQTPVNTGIPEAPTALGSYPVYVRYLSVTMSGYNPDGSYYSDPGVPYVAYFNGGDAVHGFLRGSYGYPQSLGCVELPYSAAPVVFNYDPIGTLVTVY
jgi:peptidoglycan hydrolase-like protein with peptidoglycan-binding domain